VKLAAATLCIALATAASAAAAGPRALPGTTPLPSVPSVHGLPLAPALPAPAAPAGEARLGVPGPDRLRVTAPAGLRSPLLPVFSVTT
jgi:hypothetical protein